MTDAAISHRFSREAVALALLYALGVLSLALTAISAALHHGDGAERSILVFFILGGGIAFLACRVANHASTRRALLVIIGVAMLSRLICLVQGPLLSTDVYRYIWDGRVQAAGINPYRYVPADPALAALRDTTVFPNINRAEYAPTAYPPVAQMYFLAVTRFSESVLAMRLSFVMCEIAILAMMWDLLRQFNRPITLIAAYAWHPLAIWEVSASAHVEALMAALVMLGVWLLGRGRQCLGGIAVTLAALVKPYALLALPVFWRRWDWRLPLAVIVTLAICYLPYSGVGTRALGFAPQYLAEEGLRDGLAFWPVLAVHSLVGDVPGLLVVYFAIALATLAWLALRAELRTNPSPQQRISDIAVLFVAGLFFLSPNYPWYYLVLIPLIPFGGGAPAWALTVTGPLLYLWWTPDHGIWSLIWKTVINVVFLATVLFGIAMRRYPSWIGGARA